MANSEGFYDPPEREECDRCRGMGCYPTIPHGYVWCPDCDGSGYADGWPEEVIEATRDTGAF